MNSGERAPMSADDPLRTFRNRLSFLDGCTMREVEGVLERHHVRLFVRTDSGYRWRLDVDEQRVHGLLGLRVKAVGNEHGNTIKVEGVHLA